MLGISVNLSTIDRWAVSVRGEVDGPASPNLQECLTELVRYTTADVELDLAAVTFIDSMGLRVILACHRKMTGLGRQFSICACSTPVRRVLRLVKMERLLAEAQVPR